MLALSVALAAASLSYCFRHGLLLLYGDAVSHLHIARRIFDSLNPGYRQLGSVWLPMPHLLMLPFVWRTDWWQNGLAGAWPSMASYIVAGVGMYRLARMWLEPTWALLAFLAFALNPGLLYMSTTAMTEPLFLALFLWSVIFLLDFERTTRLGKFPEAKSALWKLTAVLIAAVFTRYDGWILGTLAWCIAAIWTMQRGLWRERSMRLALILCTLLLLAAPLLWMAYNWYCFGDPLDFLRGPYSAKAIERRTTPPNSSPYPGYHSMYISAIYYQKAATMGAAFERAGRWLILLAYAGTAFAIYRHRASTFTAALLLWMPLPFYAYSVAYSAVPIFIPVWEPFAYYNTRYGMELLPAFAIFSIFAAVAVTNYRPKWKKPVMWLVAAFIVANSWLLLRATPLVLQEARANSHSRIPFERAIARNLAFLPTQDTILMYTSAHIGALEQLGFPLKQTVNEGDYRLWQHALQHPAVAADIVVAIEGDPVADAVKLHPEGLQLMDVICSTGQPCARIYRSTVQRAH
ncbi:MAG TPA: hypothetical protein VHX63_05370 [Acidobacteriaceae bacterium]|nr:hypothetical protein [Acidobacteriaceae bacterium]